MVGLPEIKTEKDKEGSDCLVKEESAWENVLQGPLKNPTLKED